jgi:hypothetical protein
VAEAASEYAISSPQALQDREAALPLNPLRAGAAAAYQNPANLRMSAPDIAATSAAAREPLVTTFDGGPAKISKDKESQPAKPAKKR